MSQLIRVSNYYNRSIYKLYFYTLSILSLFIYLPASFLSILFRTENANNVNRIEKYVATLYVLIVCLQSAPCNYQINYQLGRRISGFIKSNPFCCTKQFYVRNILWHEINTNLPINFLKPNSLKILK